MRARDTLLGVSVAAMFVSGAATSQTITYDDFNGTSIDKTRWFQGVDTTKATLANGYLRMFGRGYENDFFLFALDGLDRSKSNIEIVLHFSGFRAGGHDGAFQLFVFDAETKDPPERELTVGMTTWWDSTSRTWKTGFEGELIQTDENNKETIVWNAVESKATSGEVRFQCVSNTASVSFRATGQSQWTSLASWKDFFISNYVCFGIEVEAGESDGVDVYCDKIAVAGTMVTKGLTTYGSRCLDLGTIAIGYPHVNNSEFRVIVIGGAAFRDDSYVLAIGLQKDSSPWIGAPGCSLYVKPLLLLPGSAPLDMDGEALVALPIPNDPALKTAKFVVQAAATTNRNVAGLALSNGIELTIW